MATRKDNRTKEEAKADLLKWLQPGDTVYTILRSVSKSGMSRQIGTVCFVPIDGKPVDLHPNYAISTLLGERLNKDGDGIVVSGCGMDMGFDLVYRLAQALFGDGYALKQRWL